MPKRTAATKPSKPHPNFPLFVHQPNRWARKVRGLFYFGKASTDQNGQAALQQWLAQKDYLLAGLPISESPVGPTVHDLCNRFMTAKSHQLSGSEIVQSTFNDYLETCQHIIDQFGKTRPLASFSPQDFDGLRDRFARQWSLVTVDNEINRGRIVFRYGHAANDTSLSTRSA